MKYILFLIVLLTYSILHGKDYNLIFNFSGSYKKNEMAFFDNSKISHNVYEAEWTDNYGNYGSTYCLTSIRYDKNQIITFLDSYCRFKDQDGNKFTQHNSRKGNELSAGSGKAIFIEGEKIWKHFDPTSVANRTLSHAPQQCHIDARHSVSGPLQLPARLHVAMRCGF